MILAWVSVIGGLAVLLFSGDLLVRGAVALAERQNWPPLLIGLTIVAFGTSAPELLVSISAALKGGSANGIALGNVVGSNIANVLLVLGIPAIIYPTVCDQPAIRRTTLIMVGASLIFLWVCLNAGAMIAAWEGALLFALIIAFLGYTAYNALRGDTEGCGTEDLDDIEDRPQTGRMIALFIGVALVGLPLGSHLIVEGAVTIAQGLGVSPATIGLSIIAFGTSLPELATTVVAAMRRHCGLALGNVLGSNLFNILAIMGLTAMVASEPIPVEPRFREIDLWAMVACALLILPYAWRHWTIGRASGIAFVAAYVGFIAVLF